MVDVVDCSARREKVNLLAGVSLSCLDEAWPDCWRNPIAFLMSNGKTVPLRPLLNLRIKERSWLRSFNNSIRHSYV
jgi:hypothetical protein